MLASAKENGRVGIVIDDGCLFRGAEKSHQKENNREERNYFNRGWSEYRK
ncbi:MAG: hypothetical protein QXH16_08755 [Candidatus Bathyarchaeia archaeon]